MNDFYLLAVRFHEPLTYFSLVFIIVLAKAVNRIDKTVVSIETKLDLLLAGHKVVLDATGTSAEMDAVLRSQRRRREDAE